MASFDDKARAVAQVYATAMLETADEQGAADALREELDELGALVASDRALRDYLTNPAADAGERSRVIERLFRGRTSDLLVDSLQVLNRKGRMALLAAVVAAYGESHDVLRRRVRVKVASAVPLTAAQRARLEQAVLASTGSAPSLEETVDPSLLGGMVVRIGDRKTDGSVRTKLQAMNEALLARASRQIRTGTHVVEGV
ncbi:MAG TPA: ATP synthase F1 subunit delta [Thermoanaerobaculia bacterium]|nr:ATP synthase F1 subunit delta [Thermoanaerobaculia bacterium]